MPLPMVHLLLAETIGKRAGKEPDAAFLLGSIAPDAIHMRPGTNRHDKHVTHFFRGKQWDRAEVERHWALVAQTLKEGRFATDEERSFAEGYCIHTLLDMVWIEQFFNVLANTLRSGGIGFEDIRTIYYAETNACDAGIYQQYPWAETVYRQLAAVPSLGFSHLLTADEVSRWRDNVLGKMRGYETTVPKDTFYITKTGIATFIEDLADSILSFFAENGYSLSLFPACKTYRKELFPIFPA